MVGGRFAVSSNGSEGNPCVFFHGHGLSAGIVVQAMKAIYPQVRRCKLHWAIAAAWARHWLEPQVGHVEEGDLEGSRADIRLLKFEPRIESNYGGVMVGWSWRLGGLQMH